MKKQLSRDLLTLSVLTLITVFTWIGFEVYRALTKTEIPTVLQRQIEPLNPTIKRDIFQDLKSRRSFSTEELVVPAARTEVTFEEEVSTATEVTETEEATPAATATPSAD